MGSEMCIRDSLRGRFEEHMGPRAEEVMQLLRPQTGAGVQVDDVASFVLFQRRAYVPEYVICTLSSATEGLTHVQLLRQRQVSTYHIGLDLQSVFAREYASCYSVRGQIEAPRQQAHAPAGIDPCSPGGHVPPSNLRLWVFVRP